MDPERELDEALARAGSALRDEARFDGTDRARCDSAVASALAATAHPTAAGSLRASRPKFRRALRVALACSVFGSAAWAFRTELGLTGNGAQSAAALPPSGRPAEPHRGSTQPSRPAIALGENEPAAIVDRAPTPSRSPHPTDPAPRAPEAPKESAAELLRRAALARSSGEPRRSLELYRQLQQKFPGSAEARVAPVAIGRLLMDSLGNAEDALAEFDRYLAQGGALSEEALVGRGLALGRLGRRDLELLAWKKLVRTYPRSIHAARARARINSLTPAGPGGVSPADR